MSHIQSLEDTCRNDGSGKASPPRKKKQAAPGGLIATRLRDEYLAAARARRAQRRLWGGQDVIAVLSG
jgi:hypothetical protein